MRCVTVLAVALASALSFAATAAEGPNSKSGAADGVAPAVATSVPSLDPDLLFKPVKPCRALDSRQSGKFDANETRAVRVSGNLAGQGGPVIGCGVPASAEAVSIALSAFAAATAGTLKTIIPGEGQSSAIAASFPASGQTTTGAQIGVVDGRFFVSSNRAVHVLVDVTGYYVRPLAVTLAASGAAFAGGERVIQAFKESTGVFVVQFDRNVSSCPLNATVYSSGLPYFATAEPFGAGDTVRVRIWTTSATLVDWSVHVTAHC